MQKNMLIAGLGLVAAALIIVGILQYRQIQSLKEKSTAGSTAPVPGQTVDSAKSPKAAPGALAGKDKAAYEKKILDLKSEIGSLQAAATASSQNVAAAKAATGAAPTNALSMPTIAAMIKSPGMKEVIRTQQKATMDISHGSLFKFLSLSPENLDKFKELLLDKQMGLMDAGLELMNPSITPEERKKKTQEIAKISEEHDKKIKAMIGEDNFQVYQEFENTQPERMQVNMFKQTLSGADQMSEDAEHQLIRAMYEERTKFPFTVRMDKQEDFDPSMFSEEVMNQHLAELAKLQDKYLARASAVLTPVQLEQFKQNQVQQRVMQEMGMKMAVQMFGGSKAKPAVNVSK
jgi:hypothetical protein